MIAECQISRISTASPTKISACRRKWHSPPARKSRCVPWCSTRFHVSSSSIRLAFTKHGETGQYICVALFGVDPDRNLYWQDERWNSVTVPLNVGRQPFFVGIADNPAAGEGAKGLVTCIDLENPGVQTSAGEPLFDANGGETPYLRHKLALLAELIDGEQKSREFTDRLAALDLLQGVQLELKSPNHPAAQDQRSVFDRREETALARRSNTYGAARSAATCTRCTPCCRRSGTCRSSRAAVRLRRHRRAPERTHAKEKAPATFVTGASLLGPWQ